MWEYILDCLEANYPYLIQQVFAIGLFVFPLKFRKKFFIGFLPSFAAYIYVLFFMPRVDFGSSWQSLIIFAVAAICLWLTFEISLRRAVFSCVGAYAVLSFTMFVRLYVTSFFEYPQWAKIFIILAFMAALYPIAYFLFARKCRSEEVFEGSSLRLAVVSLFAIGLASAINILMEQLHVLSTNEGKLASLCGQLFGILLLAISFDRDKKTYERKMMEHILQEEYKKHEMLKENVEVINTKCHDIRHQLAAIKDGENGKFRASLEEAEAAVKIYDSSVRTGNETLDLILMDKSLICESRKIKFTYVINASGLGIMDTMDIYSLFGNALENAIESVMKEDDPEKRIISLNVSVRNDIINIYLENYCRETPLIRNGLPVTTKANKDVHGFGVLSIRRITEKYGGNLIFRTEDDLFKMSILLPVSEQRSKEAS